MSVKEKVKFILYRFLPCILYLFTGHFQTKFGNPSEKSWIRRELSTLTSREYIKKIISLNFFKLPFSCVRNKRVMSFLCEASWCGCHRYDQGLSPGSSSLGLTPCHAWNVFHSQCQAVFPLEFSSTVRRARNYSDSDWDCLTRLRLAWPDIKHGLIIFVFAHIILFCASIDRVHFKTFDLSLKG